jgi:NADH-quinone oxidoreductase subunit H
MTDAGTVNPLAPLIALALVLAGVWYLAVVDRLAGALAGGAGWRPRDAVMEPARESLRLLFKESRPTERPDALLWTAAPLLLVALGFAALTVMPLSPALIGADIGVGVVYLTAMIALVLVAVFASGWACNSKYPLLGGFRFVGLGLAYEMPYAITIIAVALPAESLRLGAIVAVQQETLWNALLQPLGFAIYLICALTVAFRAPFDVNQSPDLAGGSELELGGAPLLVWRLGRYVLLLTTSAFAVPLFLGGGAGPWLPDALWTVIKVMIVAGGLTALAHWLGRARLDRFMKIAWVALIPLSLLNLFLVGLVMLVFPGFFAGGTGG